ncbi:MAG: apolipoprotein N-acyltransferase, partial [Lentisphaeria bacterium]|nr:apolipoprotein N-acyltransferase [Lentisphaeria bacterium]
ILAVQGDLSQRRHATVSQVEESLTVYEELSHRAWAKHPEADIMVWPESAIPILFISNIPRFSLKMPRGATLNARYQNIVRDLCVRHRRKLLFGALDLEFDPRKRPRKDAPPPGVTNSALLFDEEGNFEARYDKFHRVPFGEYIPFRQYLPDAWARMVDMGRDLVPGVPPNPLADIDMRTKQGDRCMIRPGVVICYEGVFSYVTRLLCRRGANVLIALSNDAWYPTSSEPEQHLANATLRAVECGIPMVRVGNNSGTGIVMPSGRFEQALEVPGAETRPEIRRGRGFRVLEVPVTEYPNSTVFMCIGDLLPWLLVGFSALLVIYSMAYDCNVMEFPDDMEKQLRREHPEQYPPRNF